MVQRGRKKAHEPDYRARIDSAKHGDAREKGKLSNKREGKKAARVTGHRKDNQEEGLKKATKGTKVDSADRRRSCFR